MTTSRFAWTGGLALALWLPTARAEEPVVPPVVGPARTAPVLAPAVGLPRVAPVSHEDARIQVFIDDLASSEATIRDTAERELRALGPVAHAALREAAVHGAPEVRLRARAILRDPLG